MWPGFLEGEDRARTGTRGVEGTSSRFSVHPGAGRQVSRGTLQASLAATGGASFLPHRRPSVSHARTTSHCRAPHERTWRPSLGCLCAAGSARPESAWTLLDSSVFRV